MITLREAEKSDLSLMFNWRNQPEVYEGFYTQKEPLEWDEHKKWWESRPHTWKSFMILLDDKPIGVINVGQMEHWSPEIGWYIGDLREWKKGYAKEALMQTLRWLKSEGYEYCHTTIKWDNTRSLNLAWRCGFTLLGGAREGEVWVTNNLNHNLLV